MTFSENCRKKTLNKIFFAKNSSTKKASNSILKKRHKLFQKNFKIVSTLNKMYLNFKVFVLKEKRQKSLMMEMTDAPKKWLYYFNGHLFYWTFFLARPALIPSYWLRIAVHLRSPYNLVAL